MPPLAAADPAPDLSAATAAIGEVLDRASAGPSPTADSRAASDSGARLLDYLWVARWALTDSQKVERAIERAREMGVKGLLAQIVGRGDAYYRSDHLPRAESLSGSEFDPLGLLLDRGHAAGLEVHAWVNCMLVWSLPRRPRDPRHVVNAHPDWIARLADGRPMTRLTSRQRRRKGVEGVFLSPAHPGVRAWLGSIVKEIAERYPVDGIHLDYIRLPGVKLSPAAGGGAGAAMAGAGALRTEVECAQVSAAVGEVRDSLARVRPGLPLSAAVIADTAVAVRAHAQRWMAWLRDGLIDRAFAMCYAPPLRTVVAQLMTFAGSSGTGGRVVPGIAVYNTGPAVAAAKIRAARALGFSELALYSLDALELRPDYWTRLRNDLVGLPVASPGGRGDVR